MKKITKGTGITKRDEYLFENDEEKKADIYKCVEIFSKYKNGFERYIFMNGIETWVQQVTKDYINETKEKEDEPGKMQYETIVEEDSELQYALGTRNLIRRIRSAIERDDIDEAVQFSLQLSEKLTEVRFKFNWEKQALMGVSHSKSQSERAKHSRSKINLDGERLSITSIIKELAKKQDEWGDTPAKDLWNDLYAELDKKHLEPKEGNEGNEQIIYYSKDDDGNLDEIKFNSFKAMVSKARNKS